MTPHRGGVLLDADEAAQLAPLLAQSARWLAHRHSPSVATPVAELAVVLGAAARVADEVADTRVDDAVRVTVTAWSRTHRIPRRTVTRWCQKERLDAIYDGRRWQISTSSTPPR